MTCTSYPKALDCFSNLKTAPATKPTPVCLDASALVMTQGTSDLQIHNIAPLAEETGNVLRWLETSPRSRLAQTPLLAALQSRAEAGRGELSVTCVLGDTVCPPSPPAQGSLEKVAGSRYGQVRKKTLPEKPALSSVCVGCRKNTRSLFSMKRKKVQPDKADFLEGEKGG